MKKNYALIALALAAHSAHAIPVELKASLTTKLPACTIEVRTTAGGAVTSTYTVSSANFDENTTGEYIFGIPVAEYLVTTTEGCDKVPGFKFTLPKPAGTTKGEDISVAAHGVSWNTNTYLVDMVGDDSTNGDGKTSDIGGTALVNGIDNTRRTVDILYAKPVIDRETVTNKVKYVFSDQDARVSTTLTKSSVFFNLWTNTPITGTGGKGVQSVITPSLAAEPRSVRLKIGAMFDAAGPKVGNIYDQRAIVSGLDYGWAGTLTVTAL